MKYLAFLLIPLTFSLITNNESIQIGDSAPMKDLKMKSTKDELLSLLDLNKENGLLVIFSCNTCPFVVGNDNFLGWEKDYNELFSLVNKQKIGMVLINSNEAKRKGDDSMEQMKIRSNQKNYEMNYLMDENHKLADAFGARTTPHVFLFDNNLELIYTGSIDNSWDKLAKKEEPYLINAIEEHLAGKSISISTTSPKGCSIKRTK